ncbi:MAG: hypothetical protein ABL974_15570, partial [Prosthecobacter sp.]
MSLTAPRRRILAVQAVILPSAHSMARALEVRLPPLRRTAASWEVRLPTLRRTVATLEVRLLPARGLAVESEACLP